MSQPTKSLSREVTVLMDDYIGIFFSGKPKGRRRIGRIGNAGVAQDFIKMLRKLGHKVYIEDYTRA